MFRNCSSLTTITIPENITSISTCVFQNCSSLKEISIPDTVKKVETGVFSGCSNLQSVTFAAKLSILNGSMFMDCIKLQDVELPATITTISAGAFKNCSSLRNIYYTGTQDKWESITINTTGNEVLQDGSVQSDHIYCEFVSGVSHKHVYTKTALEESTCSKEGSRTFTCAADGDTYTEAIPMREHTAVIDKEVAATCTEEGKTTKTTLSKLTKKKTYYVRIRTYKTVSKKNYYSSWSASKTVKIKK